MFYSVGANRGQLLYIHIVMRGGIQCGEYRLSRLDLQNTNTTIILEYIGPPPIQCGENRSLRPRPAEKQYYATFSPGIVVWQRTPVTSDHDFY